MQFNTLDVMATVSGVTLAGFVGPGSFSGVHKVMDFLHPGIMTIGCAVMATPVANTISEQHPELMPFFEENKPERWTDKALTEFIAKIKESFPETLNIEKA